MDNILQPLLAFTNLYDYQGPACERSQTEEEYSVGGQYLPGLQAQKKCLFFSALLMISCYVAEFKVVLVPLSALARVWICLPSACTFPSFLPRQQRYASSLRDSPEDREGYMITLVVLFHIAVESQPAQTMLQWPSKPVTSGSPGGISKLGLFKFLYIFGYFKKVQIKLPHPQTSRTPPHGLQGLPFSPSLPFFLFLFLLSLPQPFYSLHIANPP